MRTYLLVMLLGVEVGCFNPGPAIYKCDPSNACPEGLACVAGLCASPQASDGAAPQSDAMPDLKSATGCKQGGGTPLGSAWACPGTFSPAQPASSLCAAGWSPCSSGSNVDLTACANLTSFFVSATLGKASGTGAFVCTGSDVNYPQRSIYGCGTRAGAQTLTLCGGFAKGLIPGDAAWSSPNLATSVDQTSDGSNTDGVLCCQP